MPTVIGIDPGSKESAIIGWNGKKILFHAHANNSNILWEIEMTVPKADDCFMIIELPTLYQSQPMGKDIVQTVLWCGIFHHAFGMGRSTFVKRPDVVLYFTGRRNENKAAVNLAIRDRIGGKGTKKEPGPLFGITGQHKMDALAIAVMSFDQMHEKPAEF
jgi:hypothetical protein